jgi:2-keto-3-deoxy-L-rhamnonate aldolase RhmA
MSALDLAQIVALAREVLEGCIRECLVFLFQADTHEGLEELADRHAVTGRDWVFGGQEDLGLAERTILGEQLAHTGVAVRGDLVAGLRSDAQLAATQQPSHAGAHQVGRVAVGRAHEGRDE